MQQLTGLDTSFLVMEAGGQLGHVGSLCLYDPKERILFAGDAFMGTYFSAPNPDVDSRAWIDTLRRLLQP